MYTNERFKIQLKNLLLRLSLSEEIGNELRTFEIGTNAGLSLPISELLDFVRATEQKKQDTKDTANGVFSGQYSEGKKFDKQKYFKEWDRIKKDIAKFCWRCGKLNKTDSHKEVRCKQSCKCT